MPLPRERRGARAFSLWELVLLRLSPIMFIFQAKARPRGAPSSSPSSLKLKVIGFYTMNELKYGGATYAPHSDRLCLVCTRPERFILARAPTSFDKLVAAVAGLQSKPTPWLPSARPRTGGTERLSTESDWRRTLPKSFHCEAATAQSSSLRQWHWVLEVQGCVAGNRSQVTRLRKEPKERTLIFEVHLGVNRARGPIYGFA